MVEGITLFPSATCVVLYRKQTQARWQERNVKSSLDALAFHLKIRAVLLFLTR